jgi:hypothetical protein
VCDNHEALCHGELGGLLRCRGAVDLTLAVAQVIRDPCEDADAVFAAALITGYAACNTRHPANPTGARSARPETPVVVDTTYRRCVR